MWFREKYFRNIIYAAFAETEKCTINVDSQRASKCEKEAENVKFVDRMCSQNAQVLIDWYKDGIRVKQSNLQLPNRDECLNPNVNWRFYPEDDEFQVDTDRKNEGLVEAALLRYYFFLTMGGASLLNNAKQTEQTTCLGVIVGSQENEPLYAAPKAAVDPAVLNWFASALCQNRFETVTSKETLTSSAYGHMKQ